MLVEEEEEDDDDDEEEEDEEDDGDSEESLLFFSDSCSADSLILSSCWRGLLTALLKEVTEALRLRLRERTTIAASIIKSIL